MPVEKTPIAAGGVAAIPCYLTKTCAYLQGKTIEPATILQAAEIAPISDSRGSAQYKCLLLGQLLFVHFLKLFTETLNWEALNVQNNGKSYGSSC